MNSRMAFLVFVAYLAAAPFVLSEFYITLMNFIGLATLVVLGLVLLTGAAGMMSFGQQIFVGFGAYTTAVLTTKYGASPWLALVLALIVTGIGSLILGSVTVRLSGHYLPLSTIAWGLAIYFVFGNLQVLGKYDGIQDIPPVRVLGWAFDSAERCYVLIWAATLSALVAGRNLLDSRYGRAVRAIRFRSTMAESFGVRTARLKLLMFVYSALLAGLSGWLFAHFMLFVSPGAFNVNAGIEYLFMTVIGGTSHVWGALVGATVLTLLKEWLKDILPKIFDQSGNYEIIVFGLIMLVILHRAPNGLIPLFRRLQQKHGIPAQLAKVRTLPRPQRESFDGPLLAVSGLNKRFGGLTAVDDISFEITSGEIVGLIGPNGAGKSTTFNLISGVLRPDSGEIRFKGQRIDFLPQHAIASRGLLRTFQHVNLVGEMTVLDNVAIGAHLRGRKGSLTAMLRLDRAEERQIRLEAAFQLERVGLQDQLYEAAANLPLGSQRVMEIARALAGDPILLMLDEPAAGLRFAEKSALAKLLRQLRQKGVTILLVEHDMEFVMALADRIVVMDFGRKLREGAPKEVQSDPVVVEAYLGSLN